MASTLRHVNRLLSRIAARVGRLSRGGDEARVARFKSYTMVPRQRYLDNLVLVRRCVGLDGAVVECGVWRGGMIAGVADVLGPQRAYILFDSFEGLPPAAEIDGEAALSWQADTTNRFYYDNCSAERRYAEDAMRLAGVEHPIIEQGWFEDTIKPWTASATPIAVLRLDGDWYESTMTCLVHLFPLVVTGGLVLIDDYGTWDGCTRAVHQYLADQQRPEAIDRTRSGVAYLIKR